MRDFVHTKEFQSLNAGFSLDEGKNKILAQTFS